MNNHEQQDSPCTLPYCKNCGAVIGSASWLQLCPDAPEFGAAKIVEPPPPINPIADAVRESAFDRMDRLFRNKKD